MSEDLNYIREDGVIYSIWLGNQNSVTVKRMGEELQVLASKLRKLGKPVLILANLMKLGKAPLSARREGLKLIYDLDFDRCSLFGSYTKVGGIVNAVILASGCGFKMKLLVNEKEALAWLLDYY